MPSNLEIRQQMFEMIERWHQSGLSQKSFCEKESLKLHSFYYWYRRYRQQNPATKDKSGFVKLEIEKSDSSCSLEIRFPNNIHLFFHEPVSADYVKALLH